MTEGLRARNQSEENSGAEGLRKQHLHRRQGHCEPLPVGETAALVASHER